LVYARRPSEVPTTARKRRIRIARFIDGPKVNHVHQLKDDSVNLTVHPESRVRDGLGRRTYPACAGRAWAVHASTEPGGRLKSPLMSSRGSEATEAIPLILVITYLTDPLKNNFSLSGGVNSPNYYFLASLWGGLTRTIRARNSGKGISTLRGFSRGFCSFIDFVFMVFSLKSFHRFWENNLIYMVYYIFYQDDQFYLMIKYLIWTS